jgi:hypothetical protein
LQDDVARDRKRPGAHAVHVNEVIEQFKQLESQGRHTLFSAYIPGGHEATHVKFKNARAPWQEVQLLVEIEHDPQEVLQA